MNHKLDKHGIFFLLTLSLLPLYDGMSEEEVPWENKMKSKRQRRRQANDVQDIELGKKRTEAYLKATQDSFEAAIERANKLGLADTGVLAGPRVPVKRPDK